MPKSIQIATASLVMPYSLCTAYKRQRRYINYSTEYNDGQSQVNLISFDGSRKYWSLSKKLTVAQTVALRNLFDSCNGGLLPFYFYDVYETSPMFSYDATGVATTGRYIVHFLNKWQQTMNIGALTDIQDIQLEELG